MCELTWLCVIGKVWGGEGSNESRRVWSWTCNAGPRGCLLRTAAQGNTCEQIMGYHVLERPTVPSCLASSEQAGGLYGMT